MKRKEREDEAIKTKKKKKNNEGEALSTSQEIPTPLQSLSTNSLNFRDIYSADIGTLSIIGDRAENQDSFFVKHYDHVSLTINPEHNDKIGVFCVFDGHGPCGKEASSLVSDSLPPLITSKLQSSSSIGEEFVNLAIEKSIGEVQDKLIELAQTKEGNQQEFGTTAIISILFNFDQLVVANVGDSRAVLYSKKERKVKSKILSTDHNLLRNDEIKRVREMKGRVVGKKGAKKRVLPPSSVASSDVNAKKLSLDLTRSLGHLLMREYGVISTPEFHNTSIKANDVLILASDGFWNIVEDGEICDLLNKKWEENSNKLIELCKEKIESNSKNQNQLIDNITIIIVRFIPYSQIESTSLPNNSHNLKRLDSTSTIDFEELSRTNSAIIDDVIT